MFISLRNFLNPKAEVVSGPHWLSTSRLGKSKRDRKLAAYIAGDIERGVNVSRLAKELLYTTTPARRCLLMLVMLYRSQTRIPGRQL